jgi:hypothetical protein
MSMSQANAALIIDTYAETSRLGITLTQAERMVDQASQRMGQKVDSSFGQVGNKVIRMLGAAVGAGLAIKVLDDALRKLADGIREGQGAQEIGLAIGDAVAESLKSVPVVGALGELAAMAFDPLMGGAMGAAEGRANAIAMQQARIDAEKEYQRLLAFGFSEEEARLAKKAEMERSIRESAAKAAEQFNQTEKKYDEEAYQRALEQDKSLGKGLLALASQGPGLGFLRPEAGVNREMFRTSESLTAEASAGQARVRAAMDAALTQVQMQFDRETADRQARSASEMARAEKERAAQQKQAAEEEERRIKAQEDAYDRFIRGNTQEAILALEAQLQQAGTAAAPSRGQRLADLMAGMDTGIATGETALGAFTFATGDAAQISRDILDKATQQLAVLERMEDLQRQLVELREGLN